jgi:hypothetical protein
MERATTWYPLPGTPFLDFRHRNGVMRKLLGAGMRENAVSQYRGGVRDRGDVVQFSHISAIHLSPLGEIEVDGWTRL